MTARASSRAIERSSLIALLAMAVLVLAMPQVALAQSFTISLEYEVIRAPEGSRVALGTFATPADLVGYTCTITASGNNNQSVHPGNDIEVVSATTVILPDVEGEPNKVTVSSGSIELGTSIEVWLIMGPDRVYSAELDLRFDCAPSETTTTTAPPEDTTTTTTAPPEDTTTTTTTAPPEETTTTTAPPEVEETTTTTTIPPEVSSTTVGTTPETLPFTGVETGDISIVGLVALLTGFALVAIAARSEEA